MESNDRSEFHAEDRGVVKSQPVERVDTRREERIVVEEERREEGKEERREGSNNLAPAALSNPKLADPCFILEDKQTDRQGEHHHDFVIIVVVVIVLFQSDRPLCIYYLIPVPTGPCLPVDSAGLRLKIVNTR